MRRKFIIFLMLVISVSSFSASESIVNELFVNTIKSKQMAQDVLNNREYIFNCINYKDAKELMKISKTFETICDQILSNGKTYYESYHIENKDVHKLISMEKELIDLYKQKKYLKEATAW